MGLKTNINKPFQPYRKIIFMLIFCKIKSFLNLHPQNRERYFRLYMIA
jgi:hypothetical protein